MAKINLPSFIEIRKAIADQSARFGYPPSFKAYLGRGDGVTITDPDYPVPGANQYVWYYTEEGRQGHAIMSAGAGIPYVNQPEYHGLPIQIGHLPDAFNIKAECVLGVGGNEGMAAVGGTSVINNSVTNNYYGSLDKLTNLRIQISSGLVVAVDGPFLYSDPATNVFRYYDGTGTVDLAAAQAGLSAGQHRIADLYLDPSTNTLGHVDSTPASAIGILPARSEITYTDLFALSVDGKVRIGPVYLYYGQTSIVEADILRTLDYRSLFMPPELFLVQDVSLRPAVTARNVIEPTADYCIPLTIQNKPASGFSPEALFQIKDAATNVAFNIDWLGLTVIKYWDGAADQVATPLTLGHNTSATPNTSFGTQIAFQLKSTTTNDSGVGAIKAKWEVPTHASRKGTLEFYVSDNTSEYRVFSILKQYMDLNSNQIKSVADPSIAQDAATKAYVDGSSGIGGTVILAPASGLRNTIQPTGDYIPLALKPYASQSNPVFITYDLSGTILTLSLLPNGALSERVYDASPGAVSIGFNVNHQQNTGTPAAGFGSGIGFLASDSTTADMSQGKIRTEWTTATHASRASKMVLSTYSTTTENDVLTLNSDGSAVIGSGRLMINLTSRSIDDGNKLEVKGDASAGGAAYIVATDSGASRQFYLGVTSSLAFIGAYGNHGFSFRTNNLDRLVLDASGNITTSNIALTMNNGTPNNVFTVNTSGAALHAYWDTGTNTSPTVLTLAHYSTAGAAAGFGTWTYWQSHSSTNANQSQLALNNSWVVATDASRTARSQFYTYDYGGGHEVLRFEGSGTAAMVGFLGAGAVVRQTVTGSRGGNAALASALTALANLGLITDSSSA